MCRRSRNGWCASAAPAAKPVIVATQMLESMIESPVPTPGEVSEPWRDRGIYEGADAVRCCRRNLLPVAYPVEQLRAR